MPKTRFEIQRLMSGKYSLRVFPAKKKKAEHAFLTIVGRTLGNFGSEAEAERAARDNATGFGPFEIVLVR